MLNYHGEKWFTCKAHIKIVTQCYSQSKKLFEAEFHIIWIRILIFLKLEK